MRTIGQPASDTQTGIHLQDSEVKIRLDTIGHTNRSYFSVLMGLIGPELGIQSSI